ncbi:MAG: Holliday junction branch migration protein RuvA [Clostridiales bacterium]|nr:Holliday junction branch migration protein RuvA [Clostridiales bacterium]
MIGFIKGNLISANSNGVIVLETGGIGYEITCSAQAYELIVNQGKGELFTYLNVREDGFYLYGFISQEEKSMFLKLITVSGVGPKMGIAVLSSMPLNELAFIIASQDVKSLSKVKGLGKKTAERIILELRENISQLDLPEGGKKSKDAPKLSTLEEDSVIALMSLGFLRSESETAVKVATERGADTIESVITIALQVIR